MKYIAHSTSVVVMAEWVVVGQPSGEDSRSPFTVWESFRYHLSVDLMSNGSSCGLNSVGVL